MGLFFRRSASFGPLRFNFSKSGVGASVGVKGARLTLTPKGTTYITVGRDGLYYRQTLSLGTKHPQPRAAAQVLPEQPLLDEIRTADVTELLASSKSELVENLNKRARMFNPAILLFVLGAISVAIGLSQIVESASSEADPALPSVSALSDGSRQSNRTDEYALLVARYGQPSTVRVSQISSVPVRIATYAGAHIAIVSVPVGCVDAYSYLRAHKNDTVPVPSSKRRKGSTRTVQQPHAPACVLPGNSDSTIVGYQDESGADIDSATAQSLSGLGARSNVPPAVRTSSALPGSKRDAKAVSPPPSIGYSQETFNAEQQRLANLKANDRSNQKTGSLLLAGSLLLFVPGVLVHCKNNEARLTRLVYDLSGSATTQQEAMNGALQQLAGSNMI